MNPEWTKEKPHTWEEELDHLLPPDTPPEVRDVLAQQEVALYMEDIRDDTFFLEDNIASRARTEPDLINILAYGLDHERFNISRALEHRRASGAISEQQREDEKLRLATLGGDILDLQKTRYTEIPVLRSHKAYEKKAKKAQEAICDILFDVLAEMHAAKKVAEGKGAKISARRIMTAGMALRAEELMGTGSGWDPVEFWNGTQIGDPPALLLKHSHEVTERPIARPLSQPNAASAHHITEKQSTEEPENENDSPDAWHDDDVDTTDPWKRSSDGESWDDNVPSWEYERAMEFFDPLSEFTSEELYGIRDFLKSDLDTWTEKISGDRRRTDKDYLAGARLAILAKFYIDDTDHHVLQVLARHRKDIRKTLLLKQAHTFDAIEIERVNEHAGDPTQAEGARKRHRELLAHSAQIAYALLLLFPDIHSDPDWRPICDLTAQECVAALSSDSQKPTHVYIHELAFLHLWKPDTFRNLAKKGAFPPEAIAHIRSEMIKKARRAKDYGALAEYGLQLAALTGDIAVTEERITATPPSDIH